MTNQQPTDRELISMTRSTLKDVSPLMNHRITSLCDRLESALNRIEELENPVLECAPEYVILKTESGDHWVKKHLLQVALAKIEELEKERDKAYETCRIEVEINNDAARKFDHQLDAALAREAVAVDVLRTTRYLLATSFGTETQDLEDKIDEALAKIQAMKEVEG